MEGSRDWLIRFGAISLAGGLVGARLLLSTRPALFDHMVPYLILFASLLFMVQEPVSRWLRARRRSAVSGQRSAPKQPTEREKPAERANSLTLSPAHPLTPSHVIAGLLFQFGVAVYGGFFGAGIGILMLAALGLMGMDQIHQMNGIKNFAAGCINGVAAA